MISEEDSSFTSSCDDIKPSKGNTAENFSMTRHFSSISTDEFTDCNASTAFSSPVKELPLKKISQECLPAFSMGN